MKRKSRVFFATVAIMTLLLSTQAASAASGSDVGRMSIQELKAGLGLPGLLVVDVRDEVNWSKSANKIAGAVRGDPSDVASWAAKYPRNLTVVAYCA